MRARPEFEAPAGDEINQFVADGGFSIARWYNVDGTCMVQSLISALGIIPGEILDQLQLSDHAVKPALRPTLQHYRDDCKDLGVGFYTAPDQNCNWRLMMARVYKGTKVVGGVRCIDPRPLDDTINPIMLSLDSTLWNHLFRLDLSPHSSRTIYKIMTERKSFLLRCNSLELNTIEDLRRRFDGILCAVVVLKFEIPKTNTEVGHAITLFFSKRDARCLRNCNGGLFLFSSCRNLDLSKDLYSEDLFEKDTVVKLKSAVVVYLTGYTAQEPMKGPNLPVIPKRQEARVLKKIETPKKGKRRSNVPLLAAPPLPPPVPLPNITFVGEPEISEEGNITIYIEDSSGLEKLKWCGALHDGRYHCMQNPPICRNVTLSLRDDASDLEKKLFLVSHRSCHVGCRTGPRPRFPVQKGSTNEGDN